MTFSEGMQIDTTTSTGGGGGPGRGIAIGGGVGGLLIVVVALFLGVDPSSVVPQQQGVYADQESRRPGFDLSQCKTGADANNIVQCRVVATGNSVDGVWQQLLRGYTRPQMRSSTAQFRPAAGRPPATSDRSTARSTRRRTSTPTSSRCSSTQFGSSGGPLAQEYVVAHEYRASRAEPAGRARRAQDQDAAGRDRRRCAHRIAGRLLRGRLGALRGDHHAGGHRCAPTLNR